MEMHREAQTFEKKVFLCWSTPFAEAVVQKGHFCGPRFPLQLVRPFTPGGEEFSWPTALGSTEAPLPQKDHLARTRFEAKSVSEPEASETAEALGTASLSPLCSVALMVWTWC